MKIAIIGASIAGLAATALLLKQGHEVVVYEQHPESLKDQGAGVTVTQELLDKLRENNILSEDVPIVNITKRSIVRSSLERAETIADQTSFSARALHWQTLYTLLKSKVPEKNIKTSHRVDTIENLTIDGEKFDLILGADGHNSFTAKTLFKEIKPEYAGYIAWRGTVLLDDFSDSLLRKNLNEIFGQAHESTAPYFVYPFGHCLMYLIHDPKTKNVLINWVLYEKKEEETLTSSQTVSRGQLPEAQKRYLHSLIKEILPPIAQAIIKQTTDPFVQPIYTTRMPHRINDQGTIALLGDAAGTMPPHTGSGALKGITDALQIIAALKSEGLAGIKKWGKVRLAEDTALHGLAERMKYFWVLNTPNWQNMTQDTFEEIWKKVLAGQAWYTEQQDQKPTKKVTAKL